MHVESMVKISSQRRGRGGMCLPLVALQPTAAEIPKPVRRRIAPEASIESARSMMAGGEAAEMQHAKAIKASIEARVLPFIVRLPWITGVSAHLGTFIWPTQHIDSSMETSDMLPSDPVSAHGKHRPVRIPTEVVCVQMVLQVLRHSR